MGRRRRRRRRRKKKMRRRRYASGGGGARERGREGETEKLVRGDTSSFLVVSNISYN